MTAVHFVVPDGIEDPSRPSGGNAYDCHLSRGLDSLGWSQTDSQIGCTPAPWARQLDSSTGSS